MCAGMRLFGTGATSEDREGEDCGKGGVMALLGALVPQQPHRSPGTDG